MRHTNPFSDVGYDITALQNALRGKADKYELDSLRSNVDRLERTNRELSAIVDELRARCERLEAVCRELNPGAAI